MSGIEDQGLRPANVEKPQEDDAPPETPEDVQDVPAGGAGADSGAADIVRVDPDDDATIPNVSSMNDEPGVGTRGADEEQ